MFKIRFKSILSFKKFKLFKRGFSLVELSVVIVIISILLYSIVSGNNVMKNAKVVSLMKETDSYLMATEQFINTYNYLPGDFPNAKMVFCGTDNPNCTEDGDGNGYVGNDGAGPLDSESLNFFRHLYLAGLVNKKFVGTSEGSVTFSKMSDKHYPFSKSLKNVFMYITSDSVNGSYNRLNRIAYGSTSGNGSEYRGIPGWLAKQYDCKIDDCDPTTGSIVATDVDPDDNLNSSDNNFRSIILNKAYAGNSSNKCVVNKKYNVDSMSCLVYQNIYDDDTNFFSGFENTSGGSNGGGGSSSSGSSSCMNSGVKHTYATFPTEGTTDSGARLSGTCIEGFEQEGNPFASCNNGSWSINVKCKPKKCSNSALQIAHGRFSVYSETTNYSETRLGECNEGYRRTTNSIVATCTKDGTWSYEGSCDIMTCDNSLIHVDNGTPSVSTGTTDYNSEVTVDCNTGYTKNYASFKVKCNKDSNWDYNNGNCAIVSCNNAGLNRTNYSFDSLNTATSDFGTRLTGSCAEGYANGNKTVTALCRADGTWSYENQCDIINCEKNTLNSSYFSDRTGTASYGTIIDGSCNKGYSGTVTATCGLNETGETYWNYDNKCNVKTCNLSDILDNETFGQSAVYNDSVILCTDSTCNSTSGSEIKVRGNNGTTFYSNYGSYVKLIGCVRGYSIKGSTDKIFKCDSNDDSTSEANWVLVSGDKYCSLNSGCAEFGPGNSYTLNISDKIDIKAQLWGARGGGVTGGKGGFGSVELINEALPNTLYMYVGSRGKFATAGYNGGGVQANYCSSEDNYSKSYGGGGSTDIRSSTNVSSRIAVVGGGGGSSAGLSAGGIGGGLNKNGTNGSGSYYGKAGTTSTGGNTTTNSGAAGTSLTGGTGGYSKSSRLCGGSGGGGYYGGGGGGYADSVSGSGGGGGGSGYIDSTYVSNIIATSTDSSTSNQYYDGFVRICWGNNTECDNTNVSTAYARNESCTLNGTSIESYKTLGICNLSSLKNATAETYSIGNYYSNIASKNVAIYLNSISSDLTNSAIDSNTTKIIDCPYECTDCDEQLAINCYDGIFTYGGGKCHKNCVNATISNASFSITTANHGITISGTCSSNYYNGTSGNVSATCTDGNWSYSEGCVQVCDKTKLELMDGAMIYPNSTNPQTSGDTYNNKQYFANGSVVDAHCDTNSGYSEICDDNGCNTSIGNKWSHFYYCDNGTWKQRGYCFKGCVGEPTIESPYVKQNNATNSKPTYTINDVKYFNEGSIIDTGCVDGYSEVCDSNGCETSLGRTWNTWKQCENKTWVQRGSCKKNCTNAAIANASFSTTTANHGVTINGTCNSNYYNSASGTVSATCNDGSWSYTGSCLEKTKAIFVAINNSNNKKEVYLTPNTQYTCNTSSLGTQDPSDGVLKMCKVNDKIVAYEGESFTIASSATTKCIPYFMTTDVDTSKLANTNYSSYSSPIGNQSIYSNGSEFKGTNNNSSVISCNSGCYGSPKVTCSNGKWTFSGSACVQVCDKNDLKLITGVQQYYPNSTNPSTNGTVYNDTNGNKRYFTSGATIDISCEDGYLELADSGDTTGWSHYYYCNNGNWIQKGKCEKIGCAGYPSVTNPIKISENTNNSKPFATVYNVDYYHDGSLIDTECESGYKEICDSGVGCSAPNGRNWNTWLQCENGKWVQKGGCYKPCSSKEVTRTVNSCSGSGCRTASDNLSCTLAEADHGAKKTCSITKTIKVYGNLGADGTCGDDKISMSCTGTCNNGSWETQCATSCTNN